jgi:NAD(P)-dependent dehydrogenase (short-subunit alcohol dehydrogenase family)
LREAVERLADDAERLVGGVDLVVNHAGVRVGGDVGEVPIPDWRWIVDASRLTGAEDRRALANQLMAGARIQADGVARLALDAVARGSLYVLPHPDGRWLWRMKRMAPRLFHTLTPKLLQLRARVRS